MKLKISLCFFISILFFSGCSSDGFRIPGETKIILNNISAEYDKIGDGYMGLKNYTKAIEYYNLAMTNKEFYNSCRYKIARAYALNKQYSLALKFYNELLELDPENVQLKSSVAYLYAMEGKLEEAEKLYASLLEVNPYNEALLCNYTELLLNTEKTEKAQESLELLKEKFPDNKKITGFTQKLSDLTKSAEDSASKDEKKEAPSTDEKAS